ncbi:MAG: shikimate kinase [Candidatus Altiarchaeota archaeon]
MSSKALSNGAGTIIAAFATGKGAAFGLDLWTAASVKLDDSGEIQAEIKGTKSESTQLIEFCAQEVFRFFDVGLGATIVTESNIPIAKGLKSSSTAANAVVFGLVEALRKEGVTREISDLEMVNLGIDAAFKAKVTVTGAFDDATASFFGGYTVTDNQKRNIEAQGGIEDLYAYILVPSEKSYSGEIDVGKTKAFKDEIEFLWKQAKTGEIYSALTLNGLLHAQLFGYPIEPVFKALDAGAVAAGLTGKGPATIALCPEKNKELKDRWAQFPGDVIECKTNNQKARLLK